MNRNSFVLYTDQKETIDELSDEEAGKIFKALYEYNKTQQINLNGMLKAIFMQFKIFLDKDNIKWEETKSKRSEAGKKGMKSRWKNITNDNNVITNDNNVKQVITKITDNVNVNVNDNVNVNNNIIKEKINKKEKYFENDELNNIFIEFLQIRKKLKAINSDRAINMLIKKLSNYDDATKYKMIEQSIVNSWKDIYELKMQKKKDFNYDELN